MKTCSFFSDKQVVKVHAYYYDAVSLRLSSAKAKIIAGLGVLSFAPLQAFAVKTQSIHDINYKVNVSGDIVPFLVMGGIFMLVLFGYYKASHVGKYEKFSLHCKKCGHLTRGLKCAICESRK